MPAGNSRIGCQNSRARVHDTFRDTRAQVVDGLVDPRDETVHPREEAIVIGRDAEGLRILPGAEHREDHGQVRDRIDGQQLARIPEALRIDLAAGLQRFVGQALVGVEPPGVDRRELLQRLLLDREAVGHPARACIVAESIVETRIAQHRGGQRMQREIVVPVLLRDFVELRRRRIRSRQGGRLRAGLSARCRMRTRATRQGKRAGEDDQESERCVFHWK
jgi:hypothetical protein